MKRIYWLLIAAVPVVLWWLSQGGSHQETQPAPAKPEPEKPQATPEAAKDLPTSSNGSFPKAAPAAPEATAPDQAPAPVVEAPDPVPSAAPPEKIEEAAEAAPPVAPQIEGEQIQLFDSKDRPLKCQLLDITSAQAVVGCPESLPEKEKVRLVLPYNDEAITVNCQLLGVEDGVSRFKIMTMKAGQKKRFEDYLSQRLGL